ncbi:Pheromone B alpha 3 receptor, partial [Leucoagaricus sp. SymC.cos]
LLAWNTGTCVYMGWVSLCSLLLFINAVVWHDNAINSAPIYCDIVTKLFIGLSAAIPTAAYTVNQGHRYDIFEGVGCFPTMYNTPLLYILQLGPILGIALVACVYSVLSVIVLKRNYTDFKKMLSTNKTNSATANRYIRLMCLAGLEAFADVPFNSQGIISQAMSGPMAPWVSWDETHFDFNRVEQFPAFQWRLDPLAVKNIEGFRWSVVVCGFIFFAFFGFADEAIKNYKLAYNFFARRLGLRLAYIPGLTSNTSNPNGNSSGSSGGGSGGRKEKKGGFNGSESWMNSFDAFADKVKLVVLPSGGASVSGHSTIDTSPSTGSLTNAKGRGQPQVFATTEMMQKRDHKTNDSASVLTQLTEITCATPSFNVQDEETRSTLTSSQRRPSSPYTSVVEDKDDVTSNVDSDESHYSQPSPLPTTRMPYSPPPPPIPPKDPVYSSPLAASATLLAVPSTAKLPGYHYDKSFNASVFTQQHEQSQSRLEGRTPPKQSVPTSVSVSPSPNESFLDLSSPIRDVHSADNRV